MCEPRRNSTSRLRIATPVEATNKTTKALLQYPKYQGKHPLDFGPGCAAFSTEPKLKIRALESARSRLSERRPLRNAEGAGCQG